MPHPLPEPHLLHQLTCSIGFRGDGRPRDVGAVGSHNGCLEEPRLGLHWREEGGVTGVVLGSRAGSPLCTHGSMATTDTITLRMRTELMKNLFREQLEDWRVEGKG